MYLCLCFGLDYWPQLTLTKQCFIEKDFIQKDFIEKDFTEKDFTEKYFTEKDFTGKDSTENLIIFMLYKILYLKKF